MAKRLSLGILALALAVVAAPSSASADLSGRWRVDPSGWGPFAEIQQVGNSVEIVLDVYPTYPFDGTVSGSAVQAFTSNTPCTAELSLQLLPGGKTLDGNLSFYGGDCTGFYQVYHLVLTSCECSDGDEDDGDGCDSSCRIEPCFSCSGNPSVCSPVADGSSCDDRDSCTIGETCSGSVCGNASPISDCVDLSGRWLRSLNTDFGPFVWEADVEQADGTLVFRDHTNGSIGYTGTIDKMSGAFDVSGTTAPPPCDTADTFQGQAAASGLSYAGSGLAYASSGMYCAGFEYEEHGYRCAEQENGNCTVDSCTQCTGEDCITYPDGTPCDDHDACTVVSLCSAGSCVVEQELDCPVCTVCDGAGGCMAAPRTDCRGSIDKTSTRLQLSKSATSTKDKLRWQYKKGAETRAVDLGRPDIDDDVGFCLFDESGFFPNLIYQAVIPGNVECSPDGDRCWSQSADGGFTYKDSYGSVQGITSLTLRAGGDGEAGIAMKGQGLGLSAGSLVLGSILLPTPQLQLPLRAQVQVRHAACFDGSYDEQSVSKNAEGKLRARNSQ